MKMTPAATPPSAPSNHASTPSDHWDDTAVGLSLRKPDAACPAWLDAQEPGSVVYANLGSIVVLTADQLAEFAWGLVATAPSADDSLPPEFLARTAEWGYVTAWCPQERVLRHRAVGCFLTHNGGNSTLCWPAFADGYTNCKYACEVWGVWLRLDAEVRRDRDRVPERIRSVMESKGIRACAARWKAEAEKAVCPAGGPSYESLLGMLMSAAHYH